MFTHCVTRYECFKVGITLFSSSSLSPQILIQNYLLIYFQYIVVVPNQREVVSNWLYSTSILWHNFVTLWKYSTLPPKRSSSELITVRKFTSTERFALIFCFVIQNLWNGWETEDFSNSKGFQIWRYCILLGEVLAKDTTRWNVSVCSGLSLCRLNVWVWLGLLLWMRNEFVLVCVLSVALYHWSQRVSQNVIIFLWWRFYNQYDGPIIIPLSRRCLLCSHLLYVASRLSCPWRKRNSYLCNKTISSFSSQTVHTNRLLLSY